MMQVFLKLQAQKYGLGKLQERAQPLGIKSTALSAIQLNIFYTATHKDFGVGVTTLVVKVSGLSPSENL